MGSFLVVLSERNKMPQYRLFVGTIAEYAEFVTAINEEGVFHVHHTVALNAIAVWSKKTNVKSIEKFSEIQGAKG